MRPGGGAGDVREGRERLDGPAEAHLVTDDDTLLQEREGGGEALEAAQGRREARRVEREGLDLRDEVVAEVSASRGTGGSGESGLIEQREERCRALQEVLPRVSARGVLVRAAICCARRHASSAPAMIVWRIASGVVPSLPGTTSAVLTPRAIFVARGRKPSTSVCSRGPTMAFAVSHRCSAAISATDRSSRGDESIRDGRVLTGGRFERTGRAVDPRCGGLADTGELPGEDRVAEYCSDRRHIGVAQRPEPEAVAGGVT